MWVRSKCRMIIDRGISKCTEKDTPIANLSTWIPTLLRFDLIRTYPVRKWRISAWGMVRHAVCVINTCLYIGQDGRSGNPSDLHSEDIRLGYWVWYRNTVWWFALARLGKFWDNVMNYLTTASFPVRKGIIWRHCTFRNSRNRHIVFKQSMIRVLQR